MRRFRYLCVLCLVLCLACGCGNDQKDALAQGIEALDEGRLDDAKVCFQGALSTKGGQRYRRMSGAAYRYLGVIAYQEEDFENAERYLVQAAEYSDDKAVLADTYAYLGEIYARTGREDEAIRAWSKSLDKQKDDVLSMKRMFLQWKAGQMTDREAENELAAKFTRGDLLAGRFLAQVYEKEGDEEQAVKLYLEIFEKEKDPKLLLLAAACYGRSGDTEKQMELYEEAEELLEGENLVKVLIDETAYYEARLEFEQALEKAEKALKAAPENEDLQKEVIFLRTRVNPPGKQN
ncbi:MAG: tetratricopeptide repeat protein [Lachnospiraceae bacterium]|nr:tetratricopeptide repeat protein [Lachnospiraceae bacterium]